MGWISWIIGGLLLVGAAVLIWYWIHRIRRITHPTIDLLIHRSELALQRTKERLENSQREVQYWQKEVKFFEADLRSLHDIKNKQTAEEQPKEKPGCQT